VAAIARYIYDNVWVAANDVTPAAETLVGTVVTGSAAEGLAGITVGTVGIGSLYLQILSPPAADETECEGGTACAATVPGAAGGGEPPDDEENTDAARRLGREGEEAVRRVYDIGEKQTISINGRERIPDGLLRTVLSEVKNVGRLSYTQQLRDFAAYAAENRLRFDLYVRAGAELSGPLQEAIKAGLINLIPIP
jgi:hypothetical protein